MPVKLKEEVRLRPRAAPVNTYQKKNQAALWDLQAKRPTLKKHPEFLAGLPKPPVRQEVVKSAPYNDGGWTQALIGWNRAGERYIAQLGKEQRQEMTALAHAHAIKGMAEGLQSVEEFQNEFPDLIADHPAYILALNQEFGIFDSNLLSDRVEDQLTKSASTAVTNDNLATLVDGQTYASQTRQQGMARIAEYVDTKYKNADPRVISTIFTNARRRLEGTIKKATAIRRKNIMAKREEVFGVKINNALEAYNGTNGETLRNTITDFMNAHKKTDIISGLGIPFGRQNQLFVENVIAHVRAIESPSQAIRLLNDVSQLPTSPGNTLADHPKYAAKLAVARDFINSRTDVMENRNWNKRERQRILKRRLFYNNYMLADTPENKDKARTAYMALGIEERKQLLSLERAEIEVANSGVVLNETKYGELRAKILRNELDENKFNSEVTFGIKEKYWSRKDVGALWDDFTYARKMKEDGIYDNPAYKNFMRQVQIEFNMALLGTPTNTLPGLGKTPKLGLAEVRLLSRIKDTAHFSLKDRIKAYYETNDKSPGLDDIRKMGSEVLQELRENPEFQAAEPLSNKLQHHQSFIDKYTAARKQKTPLTQDQWAELESLSKISGKNPHELIKELGGQPMILVQTGKKDEPDPAKTVWGLHHRDILNPKTTGITLPGPPESNGFSPHSLSQFMKQTAGFQQMSRDDAQSRIGQTMSLDASEAAAYYGRVYDWFGHFDLKPTPDQVAMFIEKYADYPGKPQPLPTGIQTLHEDNLSLKPRETDKLLKDYLQQHLKQNADYEAMTEDDVYSRIRQATPPGANAADQYKGTYDWFKSFGLKPAPEQVVMFIEKFARHMKRPQKQKPDES